MHGLLHIAFFTIAAISTAAAQQFEIALDSNRMLIGDQRQMQLRVAGLRPNQIDTILFDAWQGTNVEPVHATPWRHTGSESMRDIYFTVFDTGYIIIPPLPLQYRTADKKDTIYSNNLAVEVYGITIDSTGLAPLREIRKEPLNLRDFLPYIIGVVAILLTIAFFLWRPKKQRPEPIVVEIPVPADEVALRRLSELDKQKLWQSGKIKDYQSELTHIIRWYLEEKFKVPALESTTTEILKSLQDSAVTSDQLGDLNHILNMADLIKFAKATPEVTIHQDFMERAENFVRNTRSYLYQSDEEE